MTHEETYMREAIALSREGSRAGAGGPFGCVIVKNGAIIGRGYNKVLATNDPTAHAEVVAIRDACKNLNTFQLEDCDVYTSCEPWPHLPWCPVLGPAKSYLFCQQSCGCRSHRFRRFDDLRRMQQTGR